MLPRAQARILIIAGSDSGGGAGIQGDIKTVTCLGGYATTAITALTAQNTLGVSSIHEVPADFVREQIHLVLDDIGADAIKTGMLSNAEIIMAVADQVEDYLAPLIIDPVMVAKGGSPLLAPDAAFILQSRLFPLASLVTPNIPEAELLAGIPILSRSDMLQAAELIRAQGPRAVLIKGGHLLDGNPMIGNLLLSENAAHWFETPRIDTMHTHGTGCTLASAIATKLAQGLHLPEAVEAAQAYVANAIAHAPELGQGHGPLRHNYMIA